MKKFGTIFLTIYVTLTTVASALFGTLYLTNLKRDGVEFSAKALINRVCYDMKLISAEEYAASLGQNVAITSTVNDQKLELSAINLDDFNDAEVDFGPRADMSNYVLYKGLLLAKYAVDEGAISGKFYNSTYNSEVYGFKYTKTKTDIIIDIPLDRGRAESDRIVLTPGKNADDWTLTFCWAYNFSGIFNLDWEDIPDGKESVTLFQEEIKFFCEGGKIYRYELNNVSVFYLMDQEEYENAIEYGPRDLSKDIIKNFNDMDDEDFYEKAAMYYVCDTKIHNKAFYMSGIDSEYVIPEFNLTVKPFENENDMKTVILSAINATKNNLVNVDFSKIDFIEAEFGEKAMKQLNKIFDTSEED